MTLLTISLYSTCKYTYIYSIWSQSDHWLWRLTCPKMATSAGTCLCLSPPGITGIKLNFFKIIFRECLINTLTTRHDEFLSLQIFLQLKDIGYRVKWGIFAGIYYLKPRRWPGSHCIQNDDGINALGKKRLSILFVLHEEIFCLKEVVTEVNVVDLKVLITTLR